MKQMMKRHNIISQIKTYLKNGTAIDKYQMHNYNKDIRIKNKEYNFHYRVAAVIIQENKFLIQQIDGYNYYILPGGHVLLGETSLQAIEREIKEEVGK